jgi:L-amino acid N-acyltransferase YncA
MQGKGFAKEAAQAVIQEYFIQHSESILGVAIDSNEASLALLNLLGFCNDETATPYSSREGLTVLRLNKPIYSVK